MNLWEFAAALALAIAGGAAGAAVINAINERWKFKASRKAAKEDKAEEKADRTSEVEKAVQEIRKAEDEKQKQTDDRLRSIEKEMSVQSEALKLILLDRLLWLGQGYIDKGEISYDDRRRFHEMHDCYHTGLGGNGDADIIVEGVDELPLKR